MFLSSLDTLMQQNVRKCFASFSLGFMFVLLHHSMFLKLDLFRNTSDTVLFLLAIQLTDSSMILETDWMKIFIFFLTSFIISIQILENGPQPIGMHVLLTESIF